MHENKKYPNCLDLLSSLVSIFNLTQKEEKKIPRDIKISLNSNPKSKIPEALASLNRTNYAFSNA